MMKRLHSDERGFLLVVTMIMLVVLTIVGMTALDNSMFEIKIAANDRNAKVAFNMADGTIYSSSKLITEAMEASADPAHNTIAYETFNLHDGGVSVTNAPDDFYKRVMGYMETQATPYLASCTPGPCNDALYPPPDFQIKPNGLGASETIEVYLMSRSASMIAGGGAEFGAGAAGAGVGSGGAGAAVTIDVNVDAYSFNNSKSALSARYRKVLGASGGL